MASLTRKVDKNRFLVIIVNDGDTNDTPANRRFGVIDPSQYDCTYENIRPVGFNSNTRYNGGGSTTAEFRRERSQRSRYGPPKFVHTTMFVITRRDVSTERETYVRSCRMENAGANDIHGSVRVRRSGRPRA